MTAANRADDIADLRRLMSVWDDKTYDTDDLLSIVGRVPSLLDEHDRLHGRVQDLLVALRALSQSIPYPEEAESLGIILAKVGSLRALLREAAETLARGDAPDLLQRIDAAVNVAR